MFIMNYGFSRIVEHALMWGSNAVAYAEAEAPRAAIMHWCPQKPGLPFVLHVQNPVSSCSPVVSADRNVPREGECGAVGLALIKREELPALMQAPGSWSIEDMALHPMSEGRPISGINLQWGHFSVATLAEMEYASSVFDKFGHDMCANSSLLRCSDIRLIPAEPM